MKTISFSAVEVLPTLLNKTKTQTIRPAWKINEGYYEEGSEIIKIKPQCADGCCNDFIQYKKPRFKAGDKVKLMWRQRSKHEWFCRKHGEPIELTERYYSPDHNITPRLTMFLECKRGCKFIYAPDTRPICFPKLLGIATITEIFKIEMLIKEGMDNGYHFRDFIIRGNFGTIGQRVYFTPYTSTKFDMKEIIELAKRDGFKSAKDMLKWFDKHYDLSEPKQFWVYRWKWQEGKRG